MAVFSLKKAALDLIFPISCLGCGKDGSFCCSVCRASLKVIPPVCFVCKKMVPARGRVPLGRTCPYCRKSSRIYAFLSPFHYDNDLVRELVHGLKYRHIRALGPTLGDMLFEYLTKFAVVMPKNAALLPIPLYSVRQRTRGFNQAELIAQRVGELLGLSIEVKVLHKVKKTTPQVELSAEERRKNVIDTFAVSNASRVAGKTIFLLDDVKTTGATLEEAARVLKLAGAKRIWAITVAH